MYDDYFNKEKTVSEASAYNTSSLGVGLIGSVAGTGSTAIALGALGLTYTVGWAVIGSIAIGVFSTAYFNHHYDKNTYQIQDKLDKVGKVIDNTIKSVGKAIINHGLFINPISWAW